MEEIVFRALANNKKFNSIENFIQEIITSNSMDGITYDEVKEAIYKLVIYRFIRVDMSSSENCIVREDNFYGACELGGVQSWIDHRRMYRESA
ncbi:hypothetical protein [Tenacibaculum agarivorans]|uniref:hypothetical protein n=1 Tax=Tenacibaculum agarivorans TaxID=1908389 RepID=UPI00094BB66C|nr:hypothetical protein [Tenacibaculum agarivorans]